MAVGYKDSSFSLLDWTVPQDAHIRTVSMLHSADNKNLPPAEIPLTAESTILCTGENRKDIAVAMFLHPPHKPSKEFKAVVNNVNPTLLTLFSESDLKNMMTFEYEHGTKNPLYNVTNNDQAKTLRIVFAHLVLYGPHYYKTLDLMERFLTSLCVSKPDEPTQAEKIAAFKFATEEAIAPIEKELALDGFSLQDPFWNRYASFQKKPHPKTAVFSLQQVLSAAAKVDKHLLENYTGDFLTQVTNIESEHGTWLEHANVTDDLVEPTLKIAAAHLEEHGALYYSLLPVVLNLARVLLPLSTNRCHEVLHSLVWDLRKIVFPGE